MDLKDKIKHFDLEQDDEKVSFDMVSLFTNIPTHLAIKNIMTKFETVKKDTAIPRAKILQYCLSENNYFKYGDTFYHGDTFYQYFT